MNPEEFPAPKMTNAAQIKLRTKKGSKYVAPVPTANELELSRLRQRSAENTAEAGKATEKQIEDHAKYVEEMRVAAGLVDRVERDRDFGKVPYLNKNAPELPATHWKNRFDESAAAEIRELAASNVISHTALAKKYKMAGATLNKLLKNID